MQFIIHIASHFLEHIQLQCLSTVTIQDTKHNNHHDHVGFKLFVNELQAYKSFFYFKNIYLKIFNFIKYGRFTQFYEHHLCISYIV